MTCLAPLALIGVLLLALPIVVHLFKPRKMKRTPFSSLRWLKATHQRLSRRIQWHQWLLFLLRAGCILLLVVALAKPLMGFWGSKPAARLIVVDTSRTMGYQPSSGPSSLDRAAELASRFVQTARVGDTTGVIVAGAEPRVLMAPSADASSALPALRSLKATGADGDISAALPVVRALLPRQEGDVEVVFLTDNMADRWQQRDVQEFLQDLPRPVRVKVIDVGPGAAPNAWIAGARMVSSEDGAERWIRVLVGCNRESIVASSVRLTGIAGMEDETQTVAPRPGTLVRADFRIPARTSLQGQVAELRLEPADALASDDVYYLNLDASLALRVLLVEPETPGADGRNVGLHLQTAMKALADSKNQSIDVTTRTSAGVNASDFQKADVIILASAAELTDGALESLETRVRGGAGLALFLGPHLSPGFAGQKLYRAQQPGEGLMPFAPADVNRPLTGPGVAASALTNVRWAHPLLAPLHDPVQSDFLGSRYSARVRLIGQPGKSDAVLARFEDDVPAFVEHPLGAGRVLIFNMSANDEWSDLPRRKSFLPFVDQTLAYLSAGGVKHDFTVGAPIAIPLSEGTQKGDLVVTGPGGVRLTPKLTTQRGQTVLHLEKVAEAGAYRIAGAGKREIVFAINAARRDSGLQAMDAKTLAEWWAPTEVEVLSTESAGQQLDLMSSHWPLWPALVLLAGLLLVAETIYVHRLCPRANPKSADAVVAQRGLLKPIAE